MTNQTTTRSEAGEEREGTDCKGRPAQDHTNVLQPIHIFLECWVTANTNAFSFIFHSPSKNCLCFTAFFRWRILRTSEGNKEKDAKDDAENDDNFAVGCGHLGKR